MNILKELNKSFAEFNRNIKGFIKGNYAKVYSDTELKISDRSIGGKVESINADGTLGTVEDGDYEMTDGFAFSVKDGVIVSIVGQEDVPVEVVQSGSTSGSTEEVKAEDVPTEEPTPDNSTEEIKTAIADLTARIDSIEQSIADMKSQAMSDNKAVDKFSSQIEELNNSIKTLAKIPVEASKTNKSFAVEETRQDKLVALARMLGK